MTDEARETFGFPIEVTLREDEIKAKLDRNADIDRKMIGIKEEKAAANSGFNEELKGLVYSLTPKEDRTEVAQEGDHGWYRKPTLLAGISLAMVIVLNIVFG